MIDIDHFKAFNDRHGHLVGDTCLRLVADTLQRSVRRSGDIIARYGGEEFACILPETAPEAVMLLACMVEERIRALPLPAGDGAPTVSRITVSRITVSIGVATKPALIDARQWSADSLLRLADAQLYAAKAAGRSCIRGMGLGESQALAMPSLPLAG